MRFRELPGWWERPGGNWGIYPLFSWGNSFLSLRPSPAPSPVSHRVENFQAIIAILQGALYVRHCLWSLHVRTYFDFTTIL